MLLRPAVEGEGGGEGGGEGEVGKFGSWLVGCCADVVDSLSASAYLMIRFSRSFLLARCTGAFARRARDIGRSGRWAAELSGEEARVLPAVLLSLK